MTQFDQFSEFSATNLDQQIGSRPGLLDFNQQKALGGCWPASLAAQGLPVVRWDSLGEGDYFHNPLSSMNVIHSKVASLDEVCGCGVPDHFQQISAHKNQDFLVLEVLPETQKLLANFLQRSDFASSLVTAFGNGVDVSRGAALINDAAQGLSLPGISLVAGETIGAQGAYGSNGKIYLAQEFLSTHRQDVQGIATVLVEEFGHSLEAEIGSVGFGGDKGEIFAKLVTDKAIDSAELARLWSEDDSAIAIIDAEEISIHRSAAPAVGNLTNGSSDSSFIDAFSRAGGAAKVGGTLSNVLPWGYGVAQDFDGGTESRGTIMKANGSTRAFYIGGDFWRSFWTQGQISTLGYPTSDRYTTSYGQRQDFQNGAITSNPNAGIHGIKGDLGTYYKSLTDAQKQQLGAAFSESIRDPDGTWRQVFQGGFLETRNGLGTIQITSDLLNAAALKGNVGLLETGVRDVAITDAYSRNGGASKVGIALDEAQRWGSGLAQNFNGASGGYGSIMKADGSSQAFYIDGDVQNVFWAQGQISTLGYPTSDRSVTSYGQRQDFQNGAITYSAQFGFHTVKGSLGAYYKSITTAQREQLGAATTEEISVGYGWRQDFQNGTLLHSPWFGTKVVKGSVGNFYRGLTEAQRTQLGGAYTNEIDLGGGNWRQFFWGGTVEWKNNGTGEVKWTPTAIGAVTGKVEVDNAFVTKFNEVGGWDTLGTTTGAVKVVNGVVSQDFEKGSIFKTSTGTFAVRGSIGSFYRSPQGTALGLPASEEQWMGYGWRQDFQNGSLLHSPWFGTKVIKGSLGNFYRGLAETQRSQLGAAYTDEIDLGNGNWRQFFWGGTVEWKNNGTGEVKWTPTAIGALTGKVEVNNAFVMKFNESDGWNTLGTAIGAVRAANGGLVQEFQKGNIFQSGAGAFRVNILTSADTGSTFFDAYKLAGGIDKLGISSNEIRRFSTGFVQDFSGGSEERSIIMKGDSISSAFIIRKEFYQNYYDNNYLLALRFPTSNEYTTSYDRRQEFQDGVLIYSTQYGFHAIKGSLGNYYKSLATFQKDQLGAVITEEFVGSDGSRHQLFKGGAIQWKNGFGTMLQMPTPVGFNGTNLDLAFAEKFNQAMGLDALGKPTGNVRSVNGGLVQDFEKGNIFQSGTGEFRVNVLVSAETGYTFLDAYNQAGGIAKLGISTNDIHRLYNGFVQDFAGASEGHILMMRGDWVNGTFIVRQDFYQNYYDNNYFTVLRFPTSNEFNTSYDRRQEFQDGVLTYSTQYGFHAIKGSLGNYYKSLAASQKDQLGAVLTEEVVGGDGSRQQLFRNGAIQWKNGVGTVLLMPTPVGFNGTGINMAFADKFNQAAGFDALGKPTGAIRSVNGGLVQEFEKGNIFQSGAGAFTTSILVSASTGSSFLNVYNQAGGITGLGIAGTEIHPWGNGLVQDFGGGSVVRSIIMQANGSGNAFLIKELESAKFL